MKDDRFLDLILLKSYPLSLNNNSLSLDKNLLGDSSSGIDNVDDIFNSKSSWDDLHCVYNTLLFSRLPLNRPIRRLTLSAITSALSCKLDLTILDFHDCRSFWMEHTASLTCVLEYPASMSQSVRTSSGTRNSPLERRSVPRCSSHSSMVHWAESLQAHASVIGGPAVTDGCIPIIEKRYVL